MQVTALRGNTMVIRDRARDRQVRGFGGVTLADATVHQLVQLRRLRAITRRELRLALGLPCRWWRLGR